MALSSHQDNTKIVESEDNDVILRKDPETRSCINKSAYLKLHRTTSKRKSIDSLKERYENKESICYLGEVCTEENKKKEGRKESEKLKEEDIELIKKTCSSANFGYAPIPKPRRLKQETKPKDENSNVLCENQSESDLNNGDICVIVRQTESIESIDKIAKELSYFTMEKRVKDKKRTNSFKKLFTGGFFGKDKKKKDQNKGKSEKSSVFNDNFQNESFNRQSPMGSNSQKNELHIYANQNKIIEQQLTEQQARELEQKYAEMHINRFNQIRQNFNNPKSEDYVPMDNSFNKALKKTTISDFNSVPIKKYIDTSSSTSVSESDKPNTYENTSNFRSNGQIQNYENTLERRGSFKDYRQTPPRAQEMYQNFRLIKPKASIPINSERSLPNPYQNTNLNKEPISSPRTIDRNLNKGINKNYPDKPQFTEIIDKPCLEETYGTVFDSLEYVSSRNGEMKPVNSNQLIKTTSPTPKSPSLEGSKLKLPQNREIIDLQPRMKSPIPSNRVNTEKIIATELLRNSRSPTPPKKNKAQNMEIETNYPNVKYKSLSPKIPLEKQTDSQTDSPLGSSDKITTSAVVHVSSPKRPQTPNQSPVRQQNMRSSTPVSPQKDDIRKSVEAYYWKELKKMKEKQDYDLYMMHMTLNGFSEDSGRLRRSRSLSPNMQKMGRRSLSLPRDVKGQFVVEYDNYGRMLQSQPIPEGRPLQINDNRVRRNLNYEPQYQRFSRNTTERRTIGSRPNEYNNENLYRPIFRRGSLTKQDVIDYSPNINKKVSFSSNSPNVQAWPTKNGYTLSPPQRRLEKLDSNGDDDVFLPKSSVEPIYRPIRTNEGIYAGKSDEIYNSLRQSNPLYDQTYQYVLTNGPMRRLSSDSLLRQNEMNQVELRRTPLKRREVVIKDDIYGQFSGYKNAPLNQNSIYSSKQSITEPIYGYTGPKQVNVKNKVCDIYGQIHDSPPIKKSGVLIGQLQRSPMTNRHFVRGNRLTASANDMERRLNDPRYRSDTVYESYLPYDVQNYGPPTRPLPPVPRKNLISDTESGSDASEIQRILVDRPKKRAFFGKFNS